MTPELAMLSRTVDPVLLGHRIKNARIAAGLTQRQLASDDMTPGYISRVEDGQRRPSLGVLTHIAALTNTTVEVLLGTAPDILIAEQVRLDHGELALLSGDPTTALEAAAAVEAALEGRDSNDRERDLALQARYIRAGALEAAGDLNAAITVLEQLAAEPERTVRWVKALVALCRCYKEQGELNLAIQAGERAEPTLTELGLDGLTESIQLAVSVAGAYMKRGDLDHAIRICTRAADAAEKINSPVAKASAYWNASLVEARRGAHHSALDLAQRALASFEQGNDVRNVGRLRTQVAALQLKTSPPDIGSALDRLTVAEQELDWSSTTPMDKADHHLVKAHAMYLSGDLTEAREAIARARDLMGTAAPMLTAEAETLEGKVAFASGDISQARAHYTAAAHSLSGVGSDRDAAQTWFELAGLLDQVEDRDGALDAYRRAAASTGLAPAASNVNKLLTPPLH